MSQAKSASQDGGHRAPRVIRLPSPRHLFRPEPALLLVVVALLGAMSAPADLGADGVEGRDPASTTRVTAAPPPDALRWYDEAERRERGDRLRQVYAVPLGTVGAFEVGVPARVVGPRVPWNVPVALWAAYQSAASRAPASCHLDPRLLAAIGQIESGSLAGRGLDARGRAVPPVLGPVLDGVKYARIADTDDGKWDGDRTWDRAVGPMQFIPSTWARYGVDADGDGVAHPQDIQDAALSAAGYLCAGGRDLSEAEDLRAAVLAYNHSESYLAAVLALVPQVVPGGGLVRALEPVRLPAGTSTPSRAASSTSGTTTAAPTTTTTSSTTASAPTTSASSTTTATTANPTTTTTATTTTATTTTTDPTTTTTTSTTSPTSTVTTTTSPTSTTGTPTTSTTTTDECPSQSTTASGTTPPQETTSPTPTDTSSPTPTGSCPTPVETTATATASPTTSSANATEAALEADATASPTS